MRKTRLTVTEASRNFADCVNRARYQNASFELVKNGKVVARIVPATGPTKRKVCKGRALAAAVAKAHLSRDEARAWRRDLKAARRRLKAPTDKWA
jgi:prevent-host-death family protein